MPDPPCRDAPPHDDGQRGDAWVAAQVLIGLTVVVVAAAGPNPRLLRRTRRVVAMGCALAGVVVVMTSHRRLGDAFSIFPRPPESGSLTTNGPYRVVRHPMYTGVISHALAASLAGSPWALVPTAALAVVLDRKAATEENALMRRFEDYDGYRATTRWRLVPGIR